MRVTPAMCAEKTRNPVSANPVKVRPKFAGSSFGFYRRPAPRPLREGARPRLRVSLTPGIEGLQHGREILSLWREEIFIAGRMARVETSGDHAMRLQGLEPSLQRIGGDARQPLLELLEAQRSLAPQIAQDQQRPAFANHVKGARDRADLAISCSHAANVVLSFQNRK